MTIQPLLNHIYFPCLLFVYRLAAKWSWPCSCTSWRPITTGSLWRVFTSTASSLWPSSQTESTYGDLRWLDGVSSASFSLDLRIRGCNVIKCKWTHLQLVCFGKKTATPLILRYKVIADDIERLEKGSYSPCIVHTVRIDYISTAHTMWMLCRPGSTHVSKVWTLITFSSLQFWIFFHFIFFRCTSCVCDHLGDCESHVFRHGHGVSDQ